MNIFQLVKSIPNRVLSIYYLISERILLNKLNRQFGRDKDISYIKSLTNETIRQVVPVMLVLTVIAIVERYTIYWVDKYAFIEGWYSKYLNPETTWTDFLQTALGIISTILGLFIGYLGVSVQVSFERYSSKVLTYLTGERFTSNFFRLIVTSELFTILLLLFVQLFGYVPFTALICAICMFIIIFVGAYLHKDHTILKNKPESIFSQLQEEIEEAFETITTSNYSKSYSITKHLSRRVKEKFEVYFALLKDMERLKMIPDHNDGLNRLGILYCRYCAIKNLINVDQGGWFPEKESLDSDLQKDDMYQLEQYFISQGISKAGIKQIDFFWIEDLIISRFELLTNNTRILSDYPEMIEELLFTLDICINGLYSKSNNKSTKVLLGAWNLQQYYSLEKFIELESSLFMSQQINDIGKRQILQTIHNLRQQVIDGFKIRWNYATPESYQPGIEDIIESIYKEPEKLLKPINNYGVNLGKEIYDIVTNSIEALSLEYFTEKKLITPKKFSVKSFNYKIQLKELEMQEKYSHLLKSVTLQLIKHFKSEEQLAKDFLFNTLLELCQIQYSRTYTIESDIVELLKVCSSELVKIDSLKIINDDYISLAIDEAFFSTIIENRYEASNVISHLVFLLFTIAQHNAISNENRLHLYRGLLAYASFLYLNAEITGNYLLYSRFIPHVNKLIGLRQLNVIHTLEQDTSLRLYRSMRNDDMFKYNSKFQVLYDKISQVPLVDGPFYLNELDHHSEFVRRIGANALLNFSEVFTEYVEVYYRSRLLLSFIDIIYKMTNKTN